MTDKNNAAEEFVRPATPEELGVDPIALEKVRGKMAIENEKPKLSRADKALNDAMGKFEHVLVLGINSDNGIDISTSVPQYAVMQYWLNRAIFELLIHEKNSGNVEKEAENV